MSKSKTKGNRLENLVADQLTNAGIPAERIPLSGSLGGKYSSDVVIGSPEKPQFRIECKNRESISMQLWNWQANNNFVALKRNHKPILIQMTLDQFIQLLTK